MPAINIDLDIRRITNDKFIRKANDCRQDLKETIVYPTAIVDIRESEKDFPEVIAIDTPDQISNYPLGKDDRICLDFGDHQVGYVMLKLSSVGSPQDAPAFIRFKFGEIAKELTEGLKEYDGWISKSWIQEEYIHVDTLPAILKLPRRYAFRFLEIMVIDTSLKWKLVVDDVICKSVSAVEGQNVTLFNRQDELLQKIDKVSIRTLKNCMQSVFEDGPKRDRRLWIGDLRLQALANYATFKNYDLVKRCLYLFAGLTKEDGQVGACLFIEPEYIVDDTFLVDYSLFFVPILLDYYEATNDMETLRELAPCAYRQIELISNKFSENDLIEPEDGWWCFIDWTEGLDKQAAVQAVYIYCEKRGQRIAEILGEYEKAEEMKQDLKRKTNAALSCLWDEKAGLFVSGQSQQISYASQVWMVLAEVVDAAKGRELLDRIVRLNPDKGMVSPYMNHHFVEALFMCGEREKAIEHMKHYWGGMVALGADTFWELYNPQNPGESPYGSSIVNSYCHAWSCTPSYLLRRYV